MKRRLAIKRLTNSDLTIFYWQFVNQEKGGKQKAINLNRNVFIDILYPELPEWALEHDNRVPLDLYLLGPGVSLPYNVQRKIIKQPGSYKNWRLNGEYIPNPDEEPERFNVLKEGDYALFEFEGSPVPTRAKTLMIAVDEEQDRVLHEVILEWMGRKSMTELPYVDLETIVDKAGPAPEHPVYDFLLDSDLEDAVLGGSGGRANLFKRHATRPITQSTLRRRRKEAENIGHLGEEILNAFLEKRVEAGELRSFEWVSEKNAVAPYDFELVNNDGTGVILDAKSTTGEFNRIIHVSMNELVEMASASRRYDIYRLYNVSEKGAKMRICQENRELAVSVIETFKKLPAGIRPDSVSIQTGALTFGKEFELSYPVEQDEE
ncbi:protein NO VEIN domain-containing protein [Desulfatibacillum aliphaticivorans]|uniref:protein NO VEIN domain-containing protein n=1 Tax=Desulfatibacillum aliphaticivorans TaxID=218208 RepID=UPI00040465F8|nr:DUF3883 domain-containing protein [Desulfatibacillum aliphaticivorans]